MLSSPLITFAENYSFEFLDETAYGFIKSFLVSVYNDGYKKVAFINYFTPESDEGDSMLKLKLSEEIKGLQLDALKDYEVLINGVAFRTSADLVEFDAAISALCDLLADKGFLPSPVCSECGYSVAEDGDAFISVIENRACFMCDECTAEARNAVDAQSSDEGKGSKKRGVVAAVIGGFISLAVVLVLFMFAFPAKGIVYGDADTDVISSLLFCIPLFAVSTVLTFLSYRLLTGRKGPERILPCFVISVVYTLIGIYLSTAILYTNTFELSFNQAGRMLGTIICAPVTDPYFRTKLISYGLYSLAVVIAVTLIYSLIFDTKKPTQTEFIPFGKNAYTEDTEEAEEMCDCHHCQYVEDGCEEAEDNTEENENSEETEE